MLCQSVHSILGLNMAFWPVSPAHQAVARESSLSAAVQITSLIRRFRNHNGGLSDTPVLAVYALVLAFANTRLFGTQGESNVLMQYIDDLSQTWRLAALAKGWLYARN